MYSKKEMIAIGQLLKSVDDFDKKVYVSNIADSKNKDRVYTQVRSWGYVNKKRIFIGRYVGNVDKCTKTDLKKAIKDLKDRYRDHVNQELTTYNCKLEDFK